MPRAPHATLRLATLSLIAVPLLACGGTTDVSAFEPVPNPGDDTGVVSDGSPTPIPDGSAADSAVPVEDSSVPVEDSGAPDEDSAIPVEDSGAPDDTGVATDAGPADTGSGDTGAIDGGDGGVPCTEPSSAVFGGHCYFPLAERNWVTARDFCVSRGAHLVTITSAEEQAFVQTMLPGEDRWIGLYRPTGPGTPPFRWVTTEAVGYTRWAMGEPNGSGSCARIRPSDQRWADQSCSQTLNAICERE